MQRMALPSLLLSLLLLLTLTVSGVEAQGETVRIIVYRSAESLTLYLPDAGFPDITGLYIQATTAVGETLRRDLALLPAFRGLPYNRLPAPICFHMISDSSATLPLDCQTIMTLTQPMVAGDVFWHEQGDRTLVFYLGEVPQICPAGTPRCTLVFPVPPTPMPTATNTPTATFTRISTNTPIPLGYPGNPVTSNYQWIPVIQSFDGVTMVLVPAGCFDMGNDPNAYDWVENQQGVVYGGQQCFEEPFWIDQTEITQADFARLGGTAGSSSYFPGDDRPVEQITRVEARDFCQRRDARLPTEAQWEYAARGPSELLFPWGNDWNPANAVWSETSNRQTANVGSIPAGASWTGALDMIGNVWEWTSSLSMNYPYDDTHENNSDTGTARVVRGGSWYYNLPANLRASSRGNWNPGGKSNSIGFRCARSYNSES